MDEKVSYFKLRHDISFLDLQKIIDFCEENNIKYKELYEYDLEQQLSQLKQEKNELLKYKNAWEELKQDCKEVEKDDDCVLFSRLEQLERIHGIEVE